jgi:hypothetical protein
MRHYAGDIEHRKIRQIAGHDRRRKASLIIRAWRKSRRHPVVAESGGRAARYPTAYFPCRSLDGTKVLTERRFTVSIALVGTGPTAASSSPRDRPDVWGATQAFEARRAGTPNKTRAPGGMIAIASRSHRDRLRIQPYRSPIIAAGSSLKFLIAAGRPTSIRHGRRWNGTGGGRPSWRRRTGHASTANALAYGNGGEKTNQPWPRP